MPTLDPTTLAGKLLWLRAKDLGVGGSTVAAWPDQSGRAHNATGVNPAGLVVEAASTPAGGKALSVVGSTSSLTLPHLDNTIVAVSASTSFGPEPPSGGVDTGPKTYWTTNGVPSGWLQWQYATAFVATSYKISGRPDIPSRNPKDWTFEGSDDGATWTVLDTQAGVTWSGPAVEVKSFPFVNATAHKYYRLNVTANNGNSYLSVAEIFLPDAPGGVVHPAGAEAWVVVKADTSNSRALWSLGSNQSSFYPFTDGKVYETFGLSGTSSLDRVSFSPTLDLGQWRLYRVATDGAVWQAWLDNISQVTAADKPVGWLWSPVELGRNSSNTRFQGGRIAEVLMRDRVSTADEVAWLVDYFNTEHGLTVPGGEAPVGSDIVGTLDATAPAHTASVEGIVTTLGTLDATSSAHTAQIIGDVPTLVDGTLGAVGPAHVASVAGTVSIVGDLAATGPGHVAHITGSVPTSVAGTLDAVGPAHTTALAGTVPIVGTLQAVRPAHIALVAGAADLVTGDLQVQTPAHTATLSGTVPVMGTLGNPYQVTDVGAQTLDFTDALDTPTDPPAVDGDNASLDLWLTFVASDAADLSVAFDDTFPVGLEVWTGGDLAGPDEITLVASGTPASVSAPLSAGVRYYVRVHPIEASETGSGTLTWATATRSDAGDLTLDAAPEIYETPGWLSCSVSSATVAGDLQFTCSASADVLLEITADDAGQAVGIAVPLPELAVGDYTLTVLDVTSAETATASFSVLTAPTTPATPDPNATPTPPEVVTRWQIEDPAGESYSFPINPSRMSSPHSSRAFSVESVTSPAGQPLTFEGEATPSEWLLEGSVLTEDFFLALERFHALSRRLYLVDHLSRAWVVTFESLDWTQVRSAEHPWAHKYKTKFLIYDGPLSIG